MFFFFLKGATCGGHFTFAAVRGRRDKVETVVRDSGAMCEGVTSLETHYLLVSPIWPLRRCSLAALSSAGSLDVLLWAAFFHLFFFIHSVLGFHQDAIYYFFSLCCFAPLCVKGLEDRRERESLSVSPASTSAAIQAAAVVQ